MNIVCFAATEWNDAPASQRHLLGRLARRGHRVLVVEPEAGATVTLPRAWRWRDRCRVREVHDGLHVLTPRPLGGVPAGLVDRLRRRTVAAAAERLGQWAPVVLCATAQQVELAGCLRPSSRLYLAFNKLGHAPTPAEIRSVRVCDMVLTDSPAALHNWIGLHPHVCLLEPGIDPAELAADGVEPDRMNDQLPRPRLGFVGPVDGNLDQMLIAELARRFADASVVLAGPLCDGLDVRELDAHRNIRLLNLAGDSDRARLYRELDVIVVPVKSGQLSKVPLLEFLAADLPVVTTHRPEQASLAEAVTTAQSPDAFLEAVARELSEPDRMSAQRRSAAEVASWHRRADVLEEHLRQANQIASDRRRKQGLPDPRPDRHGRQVIRVEPRLDGKDASVRLMHDNYEQNGLSTQQHLLYLAARVLGLLYWGLRLPIRLMQGKGLVRRILVVRNGHLGDTVVFLPTLKALRGRYPHARITVALAPDSGARLLLEASPLVDEVLALDFFNRPRSQRFLGAMRLLLRGFDMIVGGVWYFHLPEAVYSGAPTRLGLYDGHPLQRYADRVVMLDPLMHEAENNLRLVELVTGSVPLEARVPRLLLDEPALKLKAGEIRRSLGLSPQTPVIAMHPGSKRPSRRWPPESFAELAEGFLREHADLHVVFTGAGRDEQDLIAQIRSRIAGELRDRTHDCSRAADLLGVIGFYDTCKLLICNDTGVMHVARARGVPLVAIIGPENDRRWGPHPLGPGPAVSVRNQVPGTPHGKWECEWNLSLASIDAARVKRHCDAILQGTFESTHSLKPIEAGSVQLWPLVRDSRRLSFAQIQELGLDLPRVALLLTTDPSLLGGSGRTVSPPELAAAARDLRRQQYPALQTVLVVSEVTPFAELDIGRATLMRVESGDPDAAWAAVLGGTNARFFWPARPTDRLAPTAVSNRVSVLLRGPGATVVDDLRAWPARTLIDSEFIGGPWMIERSALEMRLIHPMRCVPSTETQSLPPVAEPLAMPVAG